MKLILGLGNPGRAYEATRHNVGWWVLDHLADVWRFDGWKRDGDAITVSGRVGDLTVRLVKPQTYMNLSGAALRPFLRRPAWDASHDLLVLADEVQLPVGAFRLRARGSAGGHNGLRSIEEAVGSRDYARLRIGIAPAERPESAMLADFVLSPFGRADRATVMSLMPELGDAADTWARDGITRAMNLFNKKSKPPLE